MKCPAHIRDADSDDIQTIRDLADRTWRVCYPKIISEAQIDYMLGWMYSAEQIFAEMNSEGIRYLLAELKTDHGISEAVAFAAFGPGENEDALSLHKLYVLPQHQRKGIGSALLAEIERQARDHGAATIQLRVNRANSEAIRAYENAGYHRSANVCSDIGGGFEMDDYLMTRSLPSVQR